MDNMGQVGLEQGEMAVSERRMSWIKSASVVLHNPGKVRQQQGTTEARAIQVGRCGQSSKERLASEMREGGMGMRGQTEGMTARR